MAVSPNTLCLMLEYAFWIYFLIFCFILAFILLPLRLKASWKWNLLAALFFPIWLGLVYASWGEATWLGPGPGAGRVGFVGVSAMLVYYGPYSLIRRWMKK